MARFSICVAWVLDREDRCMYARPRHDLYQANGIKKYLINFRPKGLYVLVYIGKVVPHLIFIS